jgi:hypothetical protein
MWLVSADTRGLRERCERREREREGERKREIEIFKQ